MGPPVAGCTQFPLGSLRYVATASPSFMSQWFSTGVTAQTLARAPMLVFNAKDQLQARWMSQCTGRKLSPPSHHLPASHGFVEAACAGLGWGMNPTLLVKSHLASGQLVPLVPDATLEVPLYWQVSRVMAPALHLLTRAIVKAGQHRLGQS